MPQVSPYDNIVHANNMSYTGGYACIAKERIQHLVMRLPDTTIMDKLSICIG